MEVPNNYSRNKTTTKQLHLKKDMWVQLTTMVMALTHKAGTSNLEWAGKLT